MARPCERYWKENIDRADRWLVAAWLAGVPADGWAGTPADLAADLCRVGDGLHPPHPGATPAIAARLVRRFAGPG